MEKYDLNEGNEALKRVLLMMKYDSSKTLNENKTIILEQSGLSPAETAEITADIRHELSGDVQSSDLQDVQDILNDKVFGMSYEDGTCLLTKINNYLKKTVGSTAFDDFTTLTNFEQPFNSIDNQSLLELINNSEESSEPQFNDIKKKLINSINQEFNGFCKTKKTEVVKKPEDGVKTGGGTKTGGGKKVKTKCPQEFNTGVVYKYKIPGDIIYVYGIKDAKWYAKNTKNGKEFKVHDCYPGISKKLNNETIKISSVQPKKETENSGKPNVVVKEPENNTQPEVGTDAESLDNISNDTNALN